MFSIINSIQEWLKKFKQNKGLWFTTLFVVSIIGIAISMLLITTLTKSVAHETYMEERRIDLKQLDNSIVDHYDFLLSIGSMIAVDKNILESMQTQNQIKMDSAISLISQSISENIANRDIDINYYLPSLERNETENKKFAKISIETLENISGIVVNKKGTRLMAMVPVIENNTTLGVVELTESFHSIRNDFERLDKEFIFILDKHQLSNIDLRYKSGKYRDINELYRIAYHNYTSNFYVHAEDLNFDDLIQKKYLYDKKFYTTYTPINDLYGAPIGLTLLGEDSKRANSFVQISQNMINSVTTVALGLVISLILFMF